MISFINREHKKILYIIFISFFLNNCQLQSTNKSHGINFLVNREKILIVGKTNKNDVINLIGTPHSTSIKEDDTWIYFERSITKGKLIKLGQNILKENNVLELKFNKYGVLINKKIINKDSMQKVNYTKKKTENNVTKKSVVGKFLSSVKQKMYGQRNK
jgi:outer membrane protein assembly factor BamE (lipoprotein component of BamABCDE complex)